MALQARHWLLRKNSDWPQRHGQTLLLREVRP
jgi:hypothetical protein